MRATTRLYLITPPALDPNRFAKELEEALAGGDVASLQLRLKDVEDDAVRRATKVLKPIAQDRGVAFIMNDRPDLAAELDCDGVHVGEEDMPYAEARRLLGPDRIVGVTCGASRDRAITAAEAGADFLAVISAIWSHPKGPCAAVREFNDVFARYGRAFTDRSS